MGFTRELASADRRGFCRRERVGTPGGRRRPRRLPEAFAVVRDGTIRRCVDVAAAVPQGVCRLVAIDRIDKQRVRLWDLTLMISYAFFLGRLKILIQLPCYL